MGRFKSNSKVNQDPSIIDKAANLAKASVKYAASGFENVSDSRKRNRMDICKTCEFFGGSEDNPTCGKCGCYLNVKTSWASESCPIGKWSASKQNQTHSCKSCGKKKT